MTLTDLLKGSAIGALSMAMLFAVTPERAEAAETAAVASVAIAQDRDQPRRERPQRGDRREARQQIREARPAARPEPQPQAAPQQRQAERSDRRQNRDAARAQALNCGDRARRATTDRSFHQKLLQQITSIQENFLPEKETAGWLKLLQ